MSSLSSSSKDNIKGNSENVNQDDKRRQHNLLERKRRGNIKENFEMLNDALPGVDSEKTSRARTLHMTVKHICKMKKNVEKCENYKVECQSDVKFLLDVVKKIDADINMGKKPIIDVETKKLIENMNQAKPFEFEEDSVNENDDYDDYMIEDAGLDTPMPSPPSQQKKEVKNKTSQGPDILKYANYKPIEIKRNLGQIVNATRLNEATRKLVYSSTSSNEVYTITEPLLMTSKPTACFSYPQQDSTVYGLTKSTTFSSQSTILSSKVEAPLVSIPSMVPITTGYQFESFHLMPNLTPNNAHQNHKLDHNDKPISDKNGAT